jgi:hypothetical protein
MSNSVPVYDHSFELGNLTTRFFPEGIGYAGREMSVSGRSLLGRVWGLAQVDSELVEHGH